MRLQVPSLDAPYCTTATQCRTRDSFTTRTEGPVRRTQRYPATILFRDIVGCVQYQAIASQPSPRLLQDDEQCPSIVVPITTLDPEPFELVREIPVVVTPDEDGYLATFSDADICMTGDTKEEAVENLRLFLVDIFDDLEAQESCLGPHPKRQLAVLRDFIHRRS